MTVTTPPSAPRTSSPIPFPSPSSSSYSQYPNNTNSSQYTPSRPSSTATGTAKRKQVKNACVNCQKACKKCDDQRPCSRCIKYGIEDGCINSQRKERKRKNQDDTASSTSITSNTRIQLNLSSTRSRPPPVEAPVPMRLSSRSGIRPFPKELLESLQHEEYEDDEHKEHKEDCDHDNKPVFMEISPQVTDEFKTLAKICSDLHTVLSQPQQPVQHVNPFLYHQRPFNPFMMTHEQQQGYQFYQQPQQPQLQQFRSSSFEFEMPRVSSPPPIIQRRSISPTQLHQLTQMMQHQQATSKLLLKPSSPIYNSQLPLFQPPQQQQQQVMLRDLMNRTPPEDQDNPVDYPKQA